MAPKKYPINAKGSIRVAEIQDKVYCQVHGLANMDVANPLQYFSEAMLKKGASCFLIDLKHCRGMDSTFMGVLIGIATYENANNQISASVHILNANPHNLKLMQSLGVNQVVTVIEEAIPLPETAELVELQPQNAQNKIQLIRQAHENLVRINASNEAQFAPFLELLNKELERKS